jgi:hypothetical protein
LISNILIAYFPFSIGLKVLIGLFGIFLPFVLAWVTHPAPVPQKPVYAIEFLPAIPLWGWFFLGGIALFPRLYRLTTLLAWPHFDEGQYGYYALMILHQGLDRFLYNGVPISPFYPIWLSVWFKLTGPSLTSLWASPLPFSLAVIPLVHWTGRQWGFSRSFSLLGALLAAIGFWFWYIGRFAMQVTLIPFGETLVLGILAFLYRSRSSEEKLRWALLLGFCVGAVFYGIYFHWVIVAGLILVTLLFSFRRSIQVPLAYGAALALTCSPLWVGGFGKTGFSYLHQLWALTDPSFSWPKIENSLSYISALFWGVPARYCTYQPVWGGFLNPVLGSLWMLGFLGSARSRDPLGRWLVFASFFLLLPGLLTTDSEPFRIAPMAVPSLALIAWGFVSLFKGTVPLTKTLCFGGLLLTASFSLDLYHLAVPLHRMWDDPGVWIKYVKSINNARAFGILREKARTEGPGVVLSNFPTGVYDKTLDLADYSFNAGLNPALDPERARWAALLTNVNDQPFLRKIWGEGRSYWLSKDLPSSDGGGMLWIFPLTETNRPLLRRWLLADRSLKGFIEDYYSVSNLTQAGPYFGIRNSLSAIRTYFEGDPYLASSYWLKMADLSIKGGRLDQAVLDMGEALREGFPAAHLFYRRGVLEMALGEKEAAQKDFKKARQAPLDFTRSKDLIENNQPSSAPRK